MRRRVRRRRFSVAAIFAAMALIPIGGVGCGAAGANGVVATRATAAGPGLKVGMVVNNALGSAVPVAPGVVIATAHGFDDSGRIGAVDGYPMIVDDAASTIGNRTRSDSSDWIRLHTSSRRFHTNEIDPDVSLPAGTRVYLGGYRGTRAPADPIRFGAMSPEIVECRVLEESVSQNCPERIVPIRAPRSDYSGFSGGPAAIRDKDGRLIVFGILVRAQNVRYRWAPYLKYTELWILRLPTRQ